MIVDKVSGTRVDEVATDIYRISIPSTVLPGGFSFNSYLIGGEEPLLFHTGFRAMFAQTVAAISAVVPVETLRWIGGSHFEGDEFGALNALLAAAPQATPFGSELGVLTSISDYADRPARGLSDGEEISLHGRTLRWFYTPHVPHGWDCGVLFDEATSTLLCGDLFTQPGAETPPVTESEILSVSETMRGMLDYYAHGSATGPTLEKLANLNPSMLACQHGSAYRGDGAALLRELAARLRPEKVG